MDLFKFAQGQNLPHSSLYVVATPIGNLADISIRGLYILNQVDGIACEDKRHSSLLLNAYGISKPLYALHEHNEKAASAHIIQKLNNGERWAYISDAGTPGVSDPGAVLVEAVRSAGFLAIPIPGASALTTAISVAGNFLHQMEGRFQFLGFLPSKSTQRELLIKTVANTPTCSFFYEAPHRVEATLKTIHQILNPQKKVLIAKELSKIHEHIVVIEAGEILNWMNTQDSWQGEYVLGIEGQIKESKALDFDENTLAWINSLTPHLSHKDLSEVVAEVSGISKKEVYKQLLNLKDDTEK
jgi:16S rRNA (cytidine1402-2'-O)-methyltransferase